jgi:lipopolysaccharide export system protein LptA
VSVRSRWLALLVLLCSPAAFAESGPLDLLGSPELGEKVEKLMPSAVKDEARDAVEDAQSKAQDAVGEPDGPFSLGNFDRRAPVVINAGELEASEDESGRRLLVFRRNVEVKQATLSVRADRLSAVYPKDSSQPSRLEATGGVVVREGTREARCQRVVYDRPARQLDCIGAAALSDDDDKLAGESISFDLARRSVKVGGGSELWFDPPPESAARQNGADFAMPWLREESPVRVRAAKLDASDGPEGRRIKFVGDVRVEQKGGVLRAQQLEAIYPPGGKQPDRLVAVGDVSLQDGEREARCETAEYLRLENRVLCHGGFAVAKGDRLEGDSIDFALGEEKLSVRGRTRLVVAPRQQLEATP